MAPIDSVPPWYRAVTGQLNCFTSAERAAAAPGASPLVSAALWAIGIVGRRGRRRRRCRLVEERPPLPSYPGVGPNLAERLV